MQGTNAELGRLRTTLRRGLLTTAAFVVTLVWTGQVALQMFSPYSDFQSMTLDQLKTLQVKLTYVGPQSEGTSTVAFTSSLNTLDLSKFLPFRRPGISYSNDDSGVQTFAATPDELKVIIDNVATLPNVTAGSASPDGILSFGLLNSAGATKAFESIVNENDALALLRQIRLALQNNKLGFRALADMSCTLGLIGTDHPTDISANVSVVSSGVRLNRTTGRFVGSATIRNTSATAITGPMFLVVGLQGNVTLFSSEGHTCGTNPVGQDFVTVPLVGSMLPPGATVQVALDFTNPDSEPISPALRVLAGAGVP